MSIPFSSIIAEEQNYHVNPNSTSNRNHAVQEQLSLLKSAKKNSLHSHAESSKSSNVRRKLKLRKVITSYKEN